MNILDHIRVVPGFPAPGINFYDLHSLLERPDIWAKVTDSLCEAVAARQPDVIMGIESRGFITGLPIAQKLGLPFGMIRKKGKLPGEVIGQDYTLEYGTDRIEIQKDFLAGAPRVAILDDLLATGGTMAAAGALIKKAGGSVTAGHCIIELFELGGRGKLDFEFDALCQAPLDPAKAA